MSFVLFDKVRLFFKRNNIYSHENLLQNQNDIGKVSSSGSNVINLSDPSFFIEQSNMAINRLERYKDFDTMSEVGEISLALDLYCLHGDTKIPLLDGTCPTIKELTESGVKEFWVYSYNTETKEYTPAKAYNPHISGTNAEMVEVLFDDGLKIKCTADHKFLTKENGFVKAKDLINGQSIISNNSEVGNHKVVSVTKCEMADKVYDISVDKYHCFAAGSDSSWVIVHNSDESSVRSPEKNHSMFVKTNSIRLKEEIEDFLYNILNIDAHIRPITRYLCKYGDFPCEIVPNHNRDGVQSIKPMFVYNFTRVESKYGDLVGFFYQMDGKEPEFYHPWQVAHMRLTSFEGMYMPYGVSILDGARRDFRRLRLMEDAALVYRLCLAGDTNIWTPDGYKKIKDLKVGDEVYSYTTDNKLKKTKVVYWKHNGIDKLFKVSSQHREIVANKTHPILIETSCGNLEYTEVQNLKTGSQDSCDKFILAKKNSDDYIVYDAINNDVAKWLGVILRKNDLFDPEFVEFSTLHNVNIMDTIRLIFQLSQSIKESFIYGFISENIKCDDEIVENIKELCLQSGFSINIDKNIVERIDKFSDRIISVEEIGDGDIYDIGVESEEHNFIADGIPVHNTRSAEKRLFKVPVGNIPPKEREQYIEIIARRFKKHKFIDPVTGAMNERYAPHIQDDDYWVPVTTDGQGVEIETLQGAENLDAIADIEYFKKKMIAALKIPFSKVGLGEDSSDPGKPVAHQSPEFAKAVQWVQDQVIVGFKKIVLVHLALRGYSIDDMKNFELGMTSASAIDELYRIETWASRVDVMGGLKDLGMFPDSWIAQTFTDLTKDELELIQKVNELNKLELGEKSNEKEDSDDKEGEDFFDSRNQTKQLIIESKRNEIKDLIKEIKANKNINSPHATLFKLLNENEFDGLPNGPSSNIEDKDKLISETKKWLSNLNEDTEIINEEIDNNDIPE
jgi:hypothetical protein